MKIKKDLLSQFVRETALSGEHEIREVKLNFEKDGLKLIRITEGNHIFISSFLKSTAFEDYAEIGEITLLNYAELLKVIATMGEDISIKKEGNLLVFEGGRKVEVPLADSELIKTPTKTPDFEYPNEFIINKKFFEDMTNNMSFSLNKNDTPIVEFEGSNGVIKANYGTKYKFEDYVNVDVKQEFKVKFGVSLLNAVRNIVGDLKVFMKKNEDDESMGFPATIIKETDMYVIKLIIAPRV